MIDLPIEHAVNALIDYARDMLKHYPNEERYELTALTRQTHYEILMTVGGLVGGFYSMTTLNALDRKKADYLMLVRRAHRNHYITDKQYGNWAKKVDDVGNQIGGMKKDLEAKTGKKTK